jgi:hypothetical protein
MDLNAIKSKLSALQQKQTGGGQRKDLSATIWKPATGKHTIRIVPSAFDRANPFKELYFHYGIGNAKVMISPINFGEKDPIVEFSNELKKGQFDKDNWALSKKLQPKMRVFVPVVVRGEEEKGVRLWEFGKEVYMELLAIAEDEDVQDYTDPVNGRDLTVEKLDAAAVGNSYGKTNIRVRTKITPLAEDANQVNAWLTNQPDPNTLFKKYDYETMKTNLLEFLNPGEEIISETPAVQTPAEVLMDPETPKQAYTLEAKPKKNVDDEFAALFGN